jgi:Uma2 family endonuclease
MNAIPLLQLSIDAYLLGERTSQVRHEYVSGTVFAMAGASKRHNVISLNVASTLRTASRECVTRMAEVLVRIDQAFYYPDVMVVCEPNGDSFVETNPCLIVEVLSDATEAIDRREKLNSYRKISHLKAYVLISQNARLVDVYRRDGINWTLETYNADDVIQLDCPKSVLTLASIYDGTD